MSNYLPSPPPPVWEDPVISLDPKILATIGRLDRNMEKIMKRLAILEEPDPEKLEQFKTLKDAYTKYKFIEGLCGEKCES